MSDFAGISIRNVVWNMKIHVNRMISDSPTDITLFGWICDFFEVSSGVDTYDWVDKEIA